MDTNVTVRAVLVTRIRHIVLRGRIWIAGAVKAEVTSRRYDIPDIL